MKSIKNKKNEKKEVKIIISLILTLSILYYEILYHITTFGIANLFSLKTIIYTLFAIISSVIITLILRLIRNDKIKLRTFLGIILFFAIYYFASYMFKNMFNTFFSIRLMAIGDQAIAFASTVVLEVLKRLPILILFILPYLFALRYKKNFNFNYKHIYLELVCMVLSTGLFLVTIIVNKNINELFYNIDNNASNVEKMGVNVASYLDIKRIFFPITEEITINNSVIEEKETIYEPNKLDIDFDSLISNESDSTLKSMHEFFNSEAPTYKNELTGKYKDKNVIMFMAESLNTIAISEKYTPTLYKLSTQGYEFTNFYTPVNMSTLGGEFQNLTGLFANLSMLSNVFRKGTNYYPFGIGSIYSNLGYEVSAYHANSGTFQNRDVYLKSLGFDNYLYKGNGLEKLMNCNTWPQSDYDMVNATIDDIISKDKFFAYYVSVSGHMPWSYSGNDMSIKNKELVSDMNVSEEAQAYVAANIELDKALELIINKLSEANKLDDTVIVVVPDHYPYSMNLNTINELSTYERDLKFEVNHSTLILYNSKDEHQVVDKVSTQLDVLPTLYNLFDIEYDSRLIMGKDIFSNSDGLAYFTDRSWITNKGRYNASNSKFTSSTDEEVSQEYINNYKNIVSSRINMSKLIMEKNYYKVVLGD